MQWQRYLKGKCPKSNPDKANKILQDYFEKIQNEKGNNAKAAGEKFLAENKTKEGVHTLKSGLQYKVLKEGKGAKPKATDTVKCHYEGRLIDGTVFDSSIRRNEPAEFPVNGVIAGWVEALQLMNVGANGNSTSLLSWHTELMEPDNPSARTKPSFLMWNYLIFYNYKFTKQ